MKVLACLLLVYTLAVVADEHPHETMIQICGAELAKAMKRVCEDRDRTFLNGQQFQHVHQHNHQDHKHDHHQLHQDHHDHHQEGHAHAVKRDTLSTLTEECCAKPCHVKDFVSFCP